MMPLELADESATLAFGARLMRGLPADGLIFLHGDLGAGKTTLVRGCLRAAGHGGAVKSPTFTLVEEYQIEQRRIFHFDLYRLTDAEELEWLGMRDYLAGGALCFIEWPERGAGWLPAADVELRLAHRATARAIEYWAGTEKGRHIIAALD